MWRGALSIAHNSAARQIGIIIGVTHHQPWSVSLKNAQRNMLSARNVSAISRSHQIWRNHGSVSGGARIINGETMSSSIDVVKAASSRTAAKASRNGKRRHQ